MVSESFFLFSVMREKKKCRFGKRNGVEKQETRFQLLSFTPYKPPSHGAEEDIKHTSAKLDKPHGRQPCIDTPSKDS